MSHRRLDSQSEGQSQGGGTATGGRSFPLWIYFVLRYQYNGQEEVSWKQMKTEALG